MSHASTGKGAFFKYLKGCLVQEGSDILENTKNLAKTNIMKTFPTGRGSQS